MVTALWVLAVVLMVVGTIGTVLPALPGVVFVFGGIVVAAYAEGFTRISGPTVALLGALALVAFVVDYAASAVAAKRAGASRMGLVGAALGTVVGVFTGFVGLLFMPLVGAAIGEFLAQRDALRAGRIGVATWVGLLVGTVLKLAIVFTMLGVFVVAIVV